MSMMKVASLARTGVSARTTVRKTADSRRSSRHVCFSAENGKDDKPTTSGTIFYGGNSYTEEQWQEGLKSGRIQQATTSGTERAAVTNSTLDNLVEVMAFSGPGPEIINGRLAMLGVVTAAAAEISSGQGVLSQWSIAQTPITATFVLFMAASLVPFVIGGQKDATFGPFNAKAEMLNGRAAMLGFASLLAIEAVKGSALL